MKACRDCRHVFVTPDRKECLHPDVAEWLTDYFEGKKTLYQLTVSEARMLGKCGTEGQLWEARDT